MASQSAVGQQPEIARKMTLDTSEHDGLSTVTVSMFEDGQAKVEMEGTRPADATEAAGFRVVLDDLQDEEDRWVPEQATAQIKELPANAFVSENAVQSDSETGVSGSGSSSRSDIGTQSHGGDDGESDYDGGVWVRSEDWVDINLGITEGWIDWTTSGGEVDYVDWSWHAVTCDTGITTWHIDDAGHSYTDWGGDDVEVKFYSNYYNWDWSYNHNKTTAHHRIWAYGNPDGSMDWSTSHWHEGEDAGTLRTDAGYFANSGTHTGHC